MELSKEQEEKVFQLIETVKATGKLRKGTNEVTKSIEKGQAKLVVVAKDVSPPEVIMHIPLLSKEKSIPCVQVNSKEELGASAGLSVGTSAVAIANEGETKMLLKEVISEVQKE